MSKFKTSFLKIWLMILKHQFFLIKSTIYSQIDISVLLIIPIIRVLDKYTIPRASCCTHKSNYNISLYEPMLISTGQSLFPEIACSFASYYWNDKKNVCTIHLYVFSSSDVHIWLTFWMLQDNFFEFWKLSW